MEANISYSDLNKEFIQTNYIFNFEEFGHIGFQSEPKLNNPFENKTIFGEESFPQLVAVGQHNAVMTCLKTWLDSSLDEGLLLFN